MYIEYTLCHTIIYHKIGLYDVYRIEHELRNSIIT